MKVEIGRIIEIVSLFVKKGHVIEANSLLLADGLVDSLNAFQITLELERQFGKPISAMEVTLSDLETPLTLQAALERVWNQ